MLIGSRTSMGGGTSFPNFHAKFANLQLRISATDPEEFHSFGTWHSSSKTEDKKEPIAPTVRRWRNRHSW